MRCLFSATAMVLALATATAQQPEPVPPFRSQTFTPRVPIAWNRLYDYDELVAHLRRLVAAYPRFLSMAEIGKTSQGRPMYVVVVNNPDTGPVGAKAAMFIDANIHGNEIQGGEVCLYTLWFLMEHYDRLPYIKRLVDERTFHIQPVTNVDARVHWFAKPSTPHWPRSGLAPHDDDRDGKLDEDGFDDLDGDGEITHMRKRVEPGTGTHRLHDDDLRVMLRVRPGEKGDWVDLGSEGIDNDGDGAINEDALGGYDMNRNWPGDWRPPHLQYGAGPYPLSQPETRAVATYVLAHPEIAAYQSYHNAGGMILRGPGSPNEGDYDGRDLAVYDELGRAGEALLPFYRYMIIHRDLYVVYGGEVTWAAEDLGIVSFTNELWVMTRLTGPGGWREDERVAALKFADRLLAGEVFAPWREVEHPTLGKIEVGGFKQMYGRVPPAFLLEESYHRNAMFTFHHAHAMPRPEIAWVDTTPLGGGLVAIDACVKNPKLIPTRTARMAQKGIGRKDLMGLAAGPGIEVVAGGLLTGEVDPRLVPDPGSTGVIRVEDGIGSYGRVRARWIVRGKGMVQVFYDAVRGGRVTATKRVD